MIKSNHLSVLLLILAAAGLQAFAQSAASDAADKAELKQEKIYGKVIEAIDTDNYTYIQIDDGKEKHWLATIPVQLEAGRMISFVPRMPMKNFTSKSLDRSFDLIYFVGKFDSDKTWDHKAQPGSVESAGADANIDLENIARASGGINIDEAFANRLDLAGKNVSVRGLVVKFTPQVMEKNWLHIRDASSSKELTVTSTSSAKIGDVVLVSGALQVDKDFGYGYLYEVLLEGSSLTVE